MAIYPDANTVRNTYKNAPVETRADAAEISETGVLLEFEYNNRPRQVVPVEVNAFSLEGYVQTDAGDESGSHDDNEAPYKRFTTALMKNLKVIVAE